MSSLSPGKPAPSFTATLENGQTIRLEDFKGKKHVILFFYPKDFTPGCTAQACSLRDIFPDLSARDAVVFGVSIDNDLSHRKFRDEYKLPFPLISDPGRSLARLYGAVWFGGILPQTKRITVVIDKKGIVRRVIHHEIRVARHALEARAMLEQLRAEG